MRGRCEPGKATPRLVYGYRMLMTKRKPVGVGEMLVAEFLEPMGITQTELAARAGLPPSM